MESPLRSHLIIRNPRDYRYFLEADRLALGMSRKRPNFFGDEVWKFQRALRGLEYYTNCGRGPNGKLWKFFYKLRTHRLALACDFSIPPNVFGPGLSIAHRGTIVVNSRARIGAGCRINACTNIGANGGTSDSVPTIGNDVYIGPGAKIFGKIELADRIAVGANSVVTKSFTEPGITIAGVPAKRLGDTGSVSLIRRYQPEGIEIAELNATCHAVGERASQRPSL